MDPFQWEHEAFARRDAALAAAAHRRLLRLAAHAQQERPCPGRRRVATGWALDFKTRATAAWARLALLAPSWLGGVWRFGRWSSDAAHHAPTKHRSTKDEAPRVPLQPPWQRSNGPYKSAARLREHPL